ncbi:MAG: hypothetical protein E7264_04910 [Lachnospiraceae bacterium]|nr:hypothetical protein [Lachnospiraceae bacterium]
MKRIWNALIYGDNETRKCIGSVIFFSVLAVVLIAVAGFTSMFNLFIFGMLAAIVAIMISQTFTLVDDDFVAEVSKDGDKETVYSVSVKKNGLIYGQEPTSSKKKEANTPKGSNVSESIADPKDENKSTVKTDDLQDLNRYAKYNQKMMKKVKKKYHVKKDHRPIIIDQSEKYHIKQCPAFIWRAHNKVYLLLLEKEPRKIVIPREMIHNLGYKANVKADRAREYVAFEKDNLVTQVFSEYLPDYHDAKIKNDPLKIKNLYTIYPDICISNRSAYQVKDLLLLNFMPKDKITESDMVNGFFKRIYAANIMFKDKVISINEYKDEVELALKEMCYAEVSRREYVITLENLFKARLISKQYVSHYIAMRDKIRGEE